jgi:hypothetical protein
MTISHKRKTTWARELNHIYKELNTKVDKLSKDALMLPLGGLWLL